MHYAHGRSHLKKFGIKLLKIYLLESNLAVYENRIKVQYYSTLLYMR